MKGIDMSSNTRKIDMVILGLLSHEDMTGYDIKKHIDGAISFFWKGSFGSIYPALGAMEKNGLVCKTEDVDPDGRGKILYHITDSGTVALKDWLSGEQASNDLKYETLLKLYFGGAADRAVTIHNIELFEDDIRRDLAVLKVYKDNLEKVQDNEDHRYFLLTVMFGIETYEAYLRWCAKAEKILKQ